MARQKVVNWGLEGRRAGRAGIYVTTIFPDELRIGPERFLITNALRRAATPVKQLLRPTTKTWKKHTVGFDEKISYDVAGNAQVLIGPVGDAKSVDIWNYLNAGTTERWAVMSKNWESKTSVGVLKAGAGAGKAIITGKGSMLHLGYKGPMEGIDARGWTEMPKVLNAGVKRLYEKISETMFTYVTRDMWVRGTTHTIPVG